jgi:hypothetical protein
LETENFDKTWPVNGLSMRGAGKKARRAVLAESITGTFERATLAGVLLRAWQFMFCLVCASDAHGPSHYSESRMAGLLGLELAHFAPLAAHKDVVRLMSVRNSGCQKV